MTTADTTLEELFADYNASITATAAEITAWNTLDSVDVQERLMAGKLGGSNTRVTNVGLFGYDLTDFLDDCETSDDCDPSDYDAYTGWAIGVNWSGDAINITDGVCFTDSLWCVQETHNEGPNIVESAIVDAVGANSPTRAEFSDVLATADNPFEAWGADPTDPFSEQFAFSFFENDAEFYFEAEDTTSIWATTGALANAENVETADFVLVGAATLTTAASVIIASLLF